MSTFIKVTQEGSQLLRRNAQQTQAARLGKIEADEQAKTRQQAQAARQQALLQQGLSPSGAAFGEQRRRRFRLDEPAATAITNDALIVTWINGQPSIKSRNGEITYQFGYNYAPSTIDDLGGIPAVSVSSFFPNSEAGYGNFFVTAKSNIKTPVMSSCTLEAWGELVASGGGPLNSRYAVDIRINWNYKPFTTNATSSVFCTYDFAPSGLSNPVSIPPYERGAGSYFSCFCLPDATFDNEDEIFVSSSPPVGSFHVCIQIANYQVSYYLNGTLMKRYPIASVDIPTDELSISAIPTSLGTSSSAKMSEIRFTTNRARYALDGFTPNPPPFRS